MPSVSTPYISFFDYLLENENQHYEYYEERPNYSFNNQLHGSLVSFYDLKKDFFDTVKPYRTIDAAFRDLIQPFRGLIQLAHGIFNIVFVPVVFIVNTIRYSFTPSSFLNNMKENGIQFLGWMLEGIAHLVYGAILIPTTPLTWLRMPIRGVLTLRHPAELPKTPTTMVALSNDTFKYILSFLDGGSAARTMPVCRFLNYLLNETINGKNYWSNIIHQEFSSNTTKLDRSSFLNYYQKAYYLRAKIRNSIENSHTSQNTLNQLFAVVLNEGFDQLIPLLKDKINPSVQLRDKEGILDVTFVHLAASRGYIDLLRWLLESGAAVDTKDAGVIISRGGDGHTCSLTVAGFGATPLFRASAGGHYECVQLLLDYKADVNARRIDFKQTPLHYAASNGHVDCVTLLIERGAALNARCYMGTIPLHAAQSAGHEQCIEVITQKMQEQHIALPDSNSSCSLM